MKKILVVLLFAIAVFPSTFAMKTGTFYGDKPLGCQHRKKVVVVSKGSQRRKVGNVSQTVYFNNVSPETLSFSIKSSASHSVNAGVGLGYKDVVSFDVAFNFGGVVSMGSTATYSFTPGVDAKGAYAYVLSTKYDKYKCHGYKRESTITHTGNWKGDRSWYVYDNPQEPYIRLTRVGD